MSQSRALEALAEALALKVKRAAPRSQPQLRVVDAAPPQLFDAITRDGIYRRVQFLRRAYRLTWLVEQETFNVGSLEALCDHDLSKLLEDMERARECIAEGVSFEDAGLVRSCAESLPYCD